MPVQSPKLNAYTHSRSGYIACAFTGVAKGCQWQ